jgi:iron complex outermembrane receptor protein
VKSDVSGNPNLKAETVTALEAGYRTQWNPHLSTDIAIYSNDYHNLSLSTQAGAATFMPAGYLFVPMTFSNATTTTQTHGLEMSADWRALDWMRLEGAFTYIKMNAPAWDQINTDYARLIPRTHESLRCLMDLNEKTKLNLALRHVGALDATTQGVPAYTAADANVAYTPRKGLNISLVGQNLLGQHVEFVNNAFSGLPPSVIQRSIYAKITWSH